jgi:hypothetical protein
VFGSFVFYFLWDVDLLAEERSDDSQKDLVRSDFLLKLISGDFAIPKDLSEESATYTFAAMGGHHCAPAVGMTEEVVTSLDPNQIKAKATKCLDKLDAVQ